MAQLTQNCSLRIIFKKIKIVWNFFFIKILIHFHLFFSRIEKMSSASRKTFFKEYLTMIHNNSFLLVKLNKRNFLKQYKVSYSIFNSFSELYTCIIGVIYGRPCFLDFSPTTVHYKCVKNIIYI